MPQGQPRSRARRQSSVDGPELSQRLQLAQSTVTELVKRAEAAGLVTRQPSDQDGRVARLSLTKLGERRLLGLMRDLGKERRSLRGMLEHLEE